MTAIRTNNGRTIKLLLQGALLALIVGALFAVGWWAGETGAKRLDAEMREQLLRQANDIAREVNPELAKKLTFTAADKGTPAFDTIREQFIAAGKIILQRGIYSMAVRSGKIVFGPESYPENDPMASPPGKIYERPTPQDWQVLQTGKPDTIGPNTDEYGTFVSAMVPVLDPGSGKPLMVVAIDVLATDWQARLSAAHRKPLQMNIALLVLLAGGAFAIRRRNRRINPDRLKLRRWIIMPAALVILTGIMLYAAYGHREFTQLSHRNMTAILEQARSSLHRSLDSHAELLKAQLDHIQGSPDIQAAWRQRDLAALTALAQPAFELLKQNYSITQYSFIAPDRSIYLRVHKPDQRGDRIERATLLTAERTGEDSPGMELDALGVFSLRYVRPWRLNGELTGYLELGMEIEHMTAKLASDMNIELLTVIRKEFTSREQFEAGRKIFGFPGRWDDYPHMLVPYHTGASLPDEVGLMLARDLTAGSTDDVFSARQGDKWFSCGVLRLPDAAGRDTACLIIMRDITAATEATRGAALLNITLAVGLLGGLLLLLWSLTGSAEQQLVSAFDALKKNESLIKSMYEADPTGVALAVNRVVKKANRRFCEICGYPEEEILGQSTRIFYADEQEFDRVGRELYQSLKDSGIGTLESRWKRKDGRIIDVTLAVSPLNPGNWDEGLTSTVVDITEIKKAEEALQKEKANLKALFASSPVGMLLLDENLAITDANIEIARMIGKVPSYLLQQSIGNGLGCIHSAGGNQECDDSPACRLCSLRNAILSVLKTGRPVQGVEIQPTLLLGGMEYRPWLLVSIEPVVINDRKNLIVALANISQRKLAEKELLESQDKFSRAFDSSPVAISITLLANGQFLEVNQTFEKQTGYSRDEVIGKNSLDLGLFADHQAILQFRQAVAANGAYSNLEISMLSKTGQKKIGLLSAEAIQFGGQSCILTVAEDITERRAAEAKLAESVRILSEVQHAAHIATWTFNMLTGDLRWSDEIYYILDRSADIPLSFEEYTQYIHPDDFKVIQDVWSNRDITLTSAELEYRIIRPGGEIRHVHEYTIYKYNENTEIISLATMILDITERKQAEDALKLELAERKRVEEELKQTEGLLTDAQQIAHMGTWSFDGETGQFLLSDEAYRILGLPIGSALSFGKFPEHVHPDDIEVIAGQWGELNQNNSSFDIEYRIIRPGGEVRYIHEYTTYRTSAEGLVVNAAALLQDITERKQAEEALKLELAERRRVEAELLASERLLSGAQQIAHIGTWSCDMKTWLFRWSEEINRILGLPAETPLSYGVFSRYVHPDDYQYIAAAWSNPTAENFTGDHEYRIVRPSGEIRYIHEYTIYKFGEDGQVDNSASLLQDITERRLAEDKLRQLSQAVEQSPALIVITDTQGAIEYVNPRFIELTGYTLAEVLGKNPRILKSGDKPPEFYRELWETITAGREWHGEFQNKKKNGALYWEGASISAIRDTDGLITHFLAVKEDITQRKQAEEELKAINLQLEKTIARANEMATQAEMANVAKSEFLANMSHEIRTPMNGVIGMTGLLLDTGLTDEQLQYARIVRSSGEALLGLINDILDFSKIEAGKLDLETLDFDLRTTLEDTAELLAVKASEKGLELVSLVDPEVPVQLRGDPGRLRQIFVNLGGNAVKFTQKGSVSLRASFVAETEQQVTVRFAVTDTGIGIPRNKQQMLFTPFTQVDGSTTRKYSGTGLGLSISKQLVELMGGAIGLESKTGTGSTFWFTAVFEKQPPGQIPEVAPLADLTGIRVLVVDDHAINRLLVMTLLKSWGCRFEEAADGKAALERMQEAVAEKDPFSIALLDMHMPVMDGIELGRRIKENPDTRDTMLIMMTSLGERGDAARLEAIGFGGYLNKPLRQMQLRDCMAMVLGRGQTLQAGPASGLVTRHTVSEARKHRTRILLAEDNATNQLVALKILEKLGYRADAVADGKEALIALRDIPYDLVLMDCQMPEMDGFEATHRIRSAKSDVHNHTVPVIAMTAHAMQGDRERCLEAGMNDYLSKPVEPAQLAAILERWLPDVDPVNEKLEIAIAKATGGIQVIDQPQKSAIFDRAAFLSRLMDDEDMARIIVDGFLADMPVQIELLAKAVAAADTTAAGQQAHKIKGAAANMAAEALRAAAARIEQAGNAGQAETLPGLLHEMESCFKELQKVIQIQVRS